ncbi:MAG TPA: Smr/MutS family protein [Roseiarcus sp.]|nr:Smr/MutS family protein [Roseiarcus sp.]
MKEPSPPRSQELRPLSDEEIELWREVAKSVAPRKGAKLPTPKRAPPAAPAKRDKAAPPPAAEAKPARSTAALAPLEKRLKRQLSRGGARPDDVIDLHGMTEAEAHRALRGFLTYARSRGCRLVLVITGKGENKGAASPLWTDEPGVLRRLTPHWLRAADLRPAVLGFEEAGRGHGGAGALYVRLRRAERAGR